MLFELDCIAGGVQLYKSALHEDTLPQVAVVVQIIPQRNFFWFTITMLEEGSIKKLRRDNNNNAMRKRSCDQRTSPMKVIQDY